ncbi:uncharacterized protein A4U43_C07F34630 [Asparagus officinalis]|uniref:Uncharacterized protein n=1 Tax=Asparagus officinalis TaxID=4686 RepID=A0A5P1EH35_ASPOF|nr:uncharacterized protein A4U43_C07F34630 [Asparagus officinalis]
MPLPQDRDLPSSSVSLELESALPRPHRQPTKPKPRIPSQDQPKSKLLLLFSALLAIFYANAAVLCPVYAVFHPAAAV